MSVDLNLSPDQRQVIDAVREVLEDRLPVARLRGKRSAGADNALIPGLAQLGWLGLGLEERFGGAGFTLVDDALLFRELGRHLATPSLLAGAIAARLAIRQGDAGLADRILAGRAAICLGVDARPTGASGAPGARSLMLFDVEGAEFALILGPNSLELLPIANFASEPQEKCFDRSVTLRRVAMEQGRASAAKPRNDNALLNFANLMVSAQLQGIAEASLDVSVEYAKMRHQFGQPIGAFQSIKHRCADMKIRASVLRAQVLVAALAERESRADAGLQIAGARLLGGRYAIDNASAGIQIHGAMGFTAECDAHLFLLRAHLLDNVGSDAMRRESELGELPVPDFA